MCFLTKGYLSRPEEASGILFQNELENSKFKHENFENILMLCGTSIIFFLKNYVYVCVDRAKLAVVKRGWSRASAGSVGRG